MSGSVKRGERLIVVYGIRRVGRTSLVRAFLSEAQYPYVLVDVRQVYFTEGSVSANALVRYVLDGFREFMGRRDRL